ncbi:MAG: prephenate dehydrogenase/arogenate dehydrogenase family protein [Calditrichaeota bacterium]|nr:prephenate dehydrogenase/arogenate dehydrogenase family protein [Calditrichota bacterium]MCB9367867.1 prephenate dehydrogenase/arogenate dehydrogenase family protein [Calditrichota bacterium]
METKLKNLSKITLGGIDTITSAISLALKRAGYRGAIYGIDEPDSVSYGWRRGCITDGGGDCHVGMKGSELIVLSREGGDPRDRLATLLELAEPGSIVLDATRVKGHEDSVFESNGRTDVHHVGFHVVQDILRDEPGATPSDFYFDGKSIILTPRVKADYPAYRMFAEIFELVGAQVIAMSPNDFRDRYSLLEVIPDLLNLLQLEEVFRSMSAEEVSGDFLGSRVVGRVRRLRNLQDKAWCESFIGTSEFVTKHLANIESSIASLRNSLSEQTVRAKANEVIRKSSHIAADVKPDCCCEVIVTTAGDVSVKQKIARALAESQVVIKKLEEMSGTNGEAFKLQMNNEADRKKAVQSLRAAGIKIELTD